MTFRILPHMRLHERVADEAGFSRDEGPDYGLQPDRYEHFWLREMPQDLRDLAGVRRFGPGERIVPQPYTRDMYVRTYRWMQDWDLLDPAQERARYDEAVLV